MQRVQRSRKKGWRMPPNTVYVGRGSKWGNPFKVVQVAASWNIESMLQDAATTTILAKAAGLYDTKEAAVKAALRFYLDYFIPYNVAGGTFKDYYLTNINVLAAKAELQGKHLACWCRLDERCHADILLDILK